MTGAEHRLEERPGRLPREGWLGVSIAGGAEAPVAHPRRAEPAARDAGGRIEAACAPGALNSPAVELVLDPGRRPPWGPVSFVAAVLAPAFVCLLYLAFLAAPQYVSEARFVVRGTVERLAIEGIGPAATLTGLNNAQEAHVVADFIRSRALVERLEAEEDLRGVFSRPRYDVIWRLHRGGSLDDVLRYWRRMVTVSVEATSGIVTLRVHAFEPQDAQRLAARIVSESEAFVNAFTQRMRERRLASAEAERREAREEMEAFLRLVERARARERTVDALGEAEALTTVLSTLREERAALAAARAAAAARLEPQAPTLGILDDRLEALDEQAAAVSTSLTRDGAGASENILDAVLASELFEARRALLTRRLSQAETDALRARLELARQQVYLEVFMPPTRPERETRPDPLVSTAVLAIALSSLWALGFFYIRSVLERVA